MISLKQLSEVLRMPEKTVCLGDSDADRRLFESFTSRHPKFPLISRKTVGVALLPLDDFKTSEDYLESVGGKNSAAYFSRKAIRAGYAYAAFDPNSRADDIQRIHLSSPERQGKKMDSSYRTGFGEYPSDRRNSFYGVFKGDELVAYIWIVRSGQLLLMNRIMGHADHLRNGVMYLLVSSLIRQEIDKEGAQGRFVMYDTMLGASAGLRMFKERCGFRPYRLKWRLPVK
ncbi:MAG: hypothetical protein RL213_2222 [Bacteroidota bacterium]|jgi:hypothetical protein